MTLKITFFSPDNNNNITPHMNYSRKEIVSWVESQTKYKFQQLKNGVFFCRMLMIRFPDDAPKFKYNSAPISEYDYLNNLTAIKKLLNKHGLQLNMNINSVLNSKCNFELAKWFKALVDRQISIDTLPSFDSSRKLSKDPSTAAQRITIDSNFSKVQTPRNRLDDQMNYLRKQLESVERGSKHSSSTVKRISMAKSQNKFLKAKNPSYPDLKIPMSRKKNESKVRLNDTQHIQSFQIDEKPEDSIKTLLYQRALEQSIQGFERILQRIQKIATHDPQPDFQKLKDKLYKAIFEK